MSEVFWISYRIEYNSTYTTRYRELIERIKAVSSEQWDHTTSFHIIKSDRTISALATYFTDVLSSVDCLLIREMDIKSARFFGTIAEFNALKNFMPYVNKV